MHEPPTVAAAGLILRRATEHGWRFLLLRNPKRGEWGFPKGHQEPGEHLAQTALRECAEETGIALVAIDHAPYELLYDLPGKKRRKRVAYFPATTRQDRVVLSPEHDEFAWLAARAVLSHLAHENLIRLFAGHQRALPPARS